MNYINHLGKSIFSGWETLTSLIIGKNTLSDELSTLLEETNQLRQALEKKTGKVFLQYAQRAEQQLKDDGQTAAHRLLELNGSYFQDPLSLLKQAWDAAIKAIEELFQGTVIQTREDLKEKYHIFQSSNRTKETQLIQAYFNLEEERSTCQEALKKQISQTTESCIEERKQKLQKRKEALCGTFYEDPTGLLDQAWKKYIRAVQSSASNTEKLLKSYQQLEQKRKLIDVELSILHENTNTSSSFSKRSIEILAENAITERLKEIEQQIKLKQHPSIDMHPGLGNDF